MIQPDKIHEQLTAFINNAQIKELVTKASRKVLLQLENGAENYSVSITPAQVPELTFPEYGQLIRVYGAKAGNIGRVERHPNSFQTLFTLAGDGKTETFPPNDGFVEKNYSEQYWSFVPKNVWHRPIAGSKNWVGVTFHSAIAEDLIDEYRR